MTQVPQGNTLYFKADASVVCFRRCRVYIRQCREYTRQRRIYSRHCRKQRSSDMPNSRITVSGEYSLSVSSGDDHWPY